jgi:MFS family permease
MTSPDGRRPEGVSPDARRPERVSPSASSFSVHDPAGLAPPGPAAPRAGPLVQYALLAGPLLPMLDSSIVNVAVEPIARELHASLTAVQWTVSGYLLALGAGLAGTAYLARRFGTLPVYRASVVAFTLASALCALAPAAGVLVGARILLFLGPALGPTAGGR